MDAPPVQYVGTSDGHSIACSIVGAGQPLVLVPEPVSHIQLYWTADTYMRPWLATLRDHFRLVLYDGRGQGMSSHGLLPGHSLADELSDLEAVVDFMHLDSLVLLARSHVAVLYALAHPERVKALVLVSTPVSGTAQPSGLIDDLARQNWELFLTTLAGLTSPGDSGSIDRLRQATTQQDWLARTGVMRATDATDLLPRLIVPVLVIHPRDYRVIPIEESRKVAAAIPGASLIVIDGSTPRGGPAGHTCDRGVP